MSLAASILRDFHRGEGATVVFHGQNGREALGALPAAHLADRWEVISERMESGCYFSINSAGKSSPTKKPNATGLFASRKRKDLKFLNALFVDIDRHKEGTTDLDALTKEVMHVAEFHGLPAPSWTVKSGRGVWAVWVFNSPLRSTPETLNHWQLAAGSLADCFASLGADRASSIDASRIMRVPESRNHNAGGFRVNFTRTGEAADFYQIAKALGVTAQPTPLTTAEEKRREKNPAKVRAARARWKRTCTALEKLIQLRGTFSVGSRNWIVFYVAQAMRRAGIDKELIARRCMEIGRNNCSPALDAAEITRKIRSGETRPPHGKYTSLQDIARRFSLSPSELTKIPEFRPKQRPERKGKRIRNAISLLVSELGYTPSPSELLKMLSERGFKLCRSSLWSYLKNPGKKQCSKTAARKNLEVIHVLAEVFEHPERFRQSAS